MLQPDTRSQFNFSSGKGEWNEQATALIIEKGHFLAERIMEMHFTCDSDIARHYTPLQRAAYFSNTEHDLKIIAAAILLETPDIFRDHMAWTSDYMNARNIPDVTLKLYIGFIKDVLLEALPPELSESVAEYTDAGLEGLSQSLG